MQDRNADGKTFGQLVQEAREDAWVSRRELARFCGVKEDVVEAWEQDRERPRGRELARLVGRFSQLHLHRQLTKAPVLVKAAAKKKPPPQPEPQEAAEPTEPRAPEGALFDELFPHFGVALQRRRKQEKLTQNDLADLLGVTRGSIVMWESGKSVPRRARYWRLVELFPGLERAPIPGGPPPKPEPDHDARLRELATKPRPGAPADDAPPAKPPRSPPEPKEPPMPTAAEIVEDALTRPNAQSPKDAMKAWTRLVFELRRSGDVAKFRNFLRLAEATGFSVQELLEMLEEEQ